MTAGTYCAIPLASLTRAMIAASTARTVDRVALSPCATRAILRYLGAPPATAARFVTRDAAGMGRWCAGQPAADVETAAAARSAMTELMT